MRKKKQDSNYYNTVMPYLILKDVEAFIEFSKSVFRATEKMRHLDDNQRVVHAEIMIGESTIMAGESTRQWEIQNAGLYITVDSADEVYQKALNMGATTLMEPADKEYGRSCGVKDPQGNTWWITS